MADEQAKKTIQDRIAEIQAEIAADPTRGDHLRTLAIQAMYAGIGSDPWNAYMKEFASTPEQLARLTTFSGDDVPYVRQARCYLIANAMCLPGTDTTLMDGIEGVLDKTLP